MKTRTNKLRTNEIRPKEITADNGYVLPEFAGKNSVTFFADLPEDAVVDTIEVCGAFLEDLGGIPVYHRKATDGKFRQVATVFFPEGDPTGFIGKVSSYQAENFTVHYFEQAVVGA